MQVVRADAMGMCFGVRDALEVLDGLGDPSQVTIHGELVHNPDVLRMLAARGFHQSPEHARAVPTTPTVLVTAHGVSQRERGRLQAAGKRIVDTTCPLVRKAHDAARWLQADGRRVVVLGRPNHVEVRGIVEDLDDPIVVRDEREVARWPDERLGVVCQTTTPSERVDAVVAAIRAANPHADVCLVDTVCNPTKARGAALDALLPEVDALVVVGGRESNNTRELVARGRRRGLPVLHVEGPEDVDAAWLAGHAVVGLTAGTSTLPATIDAVHARLLQAASSRSRPRA